MTDFVAALGAREGLALEFQEVLPGRRNVLLRYLPPEKARQRILLAPHLDTVGCPEGSDSVFVPEIRGGRLWGRGACDTKGSVAAMLAALFAVARGPHRPRQTEIVFAGLIDEECCQQGSRALVKSGFRASWRWWGADPAGGGHGAQGRCLGALGDAGQCRPRRDARAGRNAVREYGPCGRVAGGRIRRSCGSGRIPGLGIRPSTSAGSAAARSPTSCPIAACWRSICAPCRARPKRGRSGRSCGSCVRGGSP